MRLGRLAWIIAFMPLPSVGWAAPPDCAAGSVASFSSPIQEWITFHASFDTGSMADLAYGEAGPRSAGSPTAARMVTGRFGRALEVGQSPSGQREIKYNRHGNVDFTSPGALSFWVRPILWKLSGIHGDYLPFLRFHSRDGTFLIERDRRNPSRDFDRIIVGLYGTGGRPSFALILPTRSRWLPDEWHLIVVSWDATGFSVSIDGAEAARQAVPGRALARTFETSSEDLGFLVGYDQPENSALDDLTIYGRILEDRDIGWLLNSCPTHSSEIGDSIGEAQRSSASSHERSRS